MSDRAPIPLVPVPIDLDSAEFGVIAAWPFDDKSSFVGRLLRDEVPNRIRYNQGRIWAFMDPDGQLVGFGVLDMCREYAEFTNGMLHPYVALLAVNPTIPSRGYGTTIVQHLISESAVAVHRLGCATSLFLDVYETNTRAIDLYKKFEFEQVKEQPIRDPDQNNQPYIIMARQLVVIAEATISTPPTASGQAIISPPPAAP